MYDMELVLGDDYRGLYSVSLTMPQAPGCLAYYFTVTNEDGTFFLPETGFYGTYSQGLSKSGSNDLVNPVGMCYDNYLLTPVSIPSRPPPPPSYQTCPKATVYWLEVGPGTGPWEGVRLANYAADYTDTAGGFAYVALQGSSINPTQGKVFLSDISLNTLVNKANFGNGSYVPAVPLVGRYAGYVYYGDVAVSSDGKYLVAVQNAGSILISTDSGLTWEAQSGAPEGGWNSVAISSNGENLVAAMQAAFDGRGGQPIWTSSSGGATWQSHPTASTSASDKWLAVASSSTGDRLIALTNTNFYYTSDDFGNTWTQRDTFAVPRSPIFSCIASSSDGMRLVAGGSTVYLDLLNLYTSDDGGSSWIMREGTELAIWLAVASSSSGSRLVATQLQTSVVADFKGYIHMSRDSGDNWFRLDSAPQGSWKDIALSGEEG